MAEITQNFSMKIETLSQLNLNDKPRKSIAQRGKIKASTLIARTGHSFSPKLRSTISDKEEEEERKSDPTINVISLCVIPENTKKNLCFQKSKKNSKLWVDVNNRFREDFRTYKD